jgi:hypothetical protein
VDQGPDTDRSRGCYYDFHHLDHPDDLPHSWTKKLPTGERKRFALRTTTVCSGRPVSHARYSIDCTAITLFHYHYQKVA